MNRARPSTSRAILLGLTLAACSGGSSSTPAPLSGNVGPRTTGSRTGGGEGDALAAALLLSAGFAADRPGRATMGMDDPALRTRIVRMSVDHLATQALAADAGASQIGTAYIRRLAQSSGLEDRDGNGVNLDEVLAAHHERLAGHLGGTAPTPIRSVLFPWRDGVADFAAPVDPAAPRGAVAPGQEGVVDLAQVAQAMHARVVLGGGLLRRGSGATVSEGVVGLLLLQQAVAMEETIFSSLFVAGSVLSGLPFPQDYDPLREPRWVPRSVRVSTSTTVPGLVAAYGIGDRSSHLETLAGLLRSGAEMAYLAAPGQPDPALGALFSGLVFGPLPQPEGGKGGGGGGNLVTWEDGVGALFAEKCAGCHDSNFKPEPGLFAADSYDNVHLGGRNSRPGTATPIITRGDPMRSMLYRILLPDPPSPFFRMPDGGPYFEAPELALVEQWILDGARSAAPAPPRIGRDLAGIMFRNLRALHLEQDGSLASIFDGEGRIPFATSASTGLALQGLAALDGVRALAPDLHQVLRAVADRAAQQLTRPTGEVVEGWNLATGIPTGPGGLLAHSRITAGLLAAGRVLGSPALLERGELVGRRWLEQFFDPARGTFRSRAGVEGARFTPTILAAILDGLREMAAAGVGEAVATQQAFLRRLAPVLAYSELAGGGEILGDGIPDTDDNGVPEPAAAGGPFGRAPLFAGEILDGPALDANDAPITWSEHIQPLFRSKCGACHMDGSQRGDGYLLDTPTMLRRSIYPAFPIPLIVPGDPESSWLYRKLVERRPLVGAQMPLASPPLSDHGKELVRRWILEGATSR